MNFDNYVLVKREEYFNKLKKDKFLEKYSKFDFEKINNKNYEQLYECGILQELYDINKSITQSFRVNSGKYFEKIIEECLIKCNIDYMKQVFISEDGDITEKKNKQKGHYIDFICPSVNYNTNIKNYTGKIISCKTTLRERYLQDKYFDNVYYIKLDKSSNNNIISISESDKSFSNFLNTLKQKPESEKIHSNKKINVIDLFCGAGGFSTGFMMSNSGTSETLCNAKYNIVCGIDHSQSKIETYNSNHNNIGICADISNYKPEDLNITNTSIDLIIGGPPCQGFSMAGKRDKKDPRNSLFMEYLKFVKYFKPKMFIIENVQGILTMKTEKNELVIDIIQTECNKIGYNIKYSKLIASDYGVPQKRKRVFIIGTKQDSDINITFPVKTCIKPVPVKDFLIPKEEIDIKYFHSQKMIDGFNRRKENNKLNNKGFGAQYLKMDEPSYTISARYYKDGSDALVKYSDTEIRMLTEKECARIQSFPEDYNFIGSKKEIYEQIGNAVPPLLAKNIAQHLLKYF